MPEPGLLKRVTWQRVLRNVAQAPDLAWPVNAVREKHGIAAD